MDMPLIIARSGATDLARAEAFALGPLTVDPPARRVTCGARGAILEPRVMRVLVAMGEARGRVLSRDELIELCWDGQIVGDKAITRAIGLLRHTLGDLAGDAVQIETITKVGFRLIAGDGPPQAEHTALPQALSQFVGEAGVPRLRGVWSRRAVAGGIAATAAGGALAYGLWLRRAPHVPDPRAVEHYRRGQAVQKGGVFDSKGEALAAFKQAVAIDPRYADAWGALALSYRFGNQMRLSDPQTVLAPARRALALDPGNADAKLAMIMLYPYYRHWRERETALRGLLRDHPDYALGHVRLGWLLFNVGRLEDAIDLSQRAIDLDATLQTGWRLAANAYYFAGLDSQGDLAIEEARSRWPQDATLYGGAFFLLLESKRFDDALAYLRDSSRRPRMVRPEMVEKLMRMADAFASGRDLAEFRNMARTKVQPAVGHIQSLDIAAPNLAMLGMVDELFALLEAYFFGGNVGTTPLPPPGPLDPRFTSTLFAPALAGLRGDPRYASILQRTGLEDYWRKTGIRPDFRLGE